MGKRSHMMMPHMMPMMGGMPMVLPPQDQGSSSDEADTTSRRKKVKVSAEPSGAASSDVPVTDPEGPGYHRGKKYCKTIDAVITSRRQVSSLWENAGLGRQLNGCRNAWMPPWLRTCQVMDC